MTPTTESTEPRCRANGCLCEQPETCRFNVPEPLPMKHFTSGDYVSLKTDKRQLSIKMDGKSPAEAVAKYRDELEYQIDRLTSQLEFLKPFLSGQSVSDPDALRF